MRKIFFIFFAAFFCFGFIASEFKKIPKRVIDKVEKAAKEIYGNENFELIPIAVPEIVQKGINIDLTDDRLLKVITVNSIFGYIYIGEASSKKELFDYAIFFDADLRIKKSKVLIYRENYGRQIGSQRWLKQFIGKRIGDPIEYGQDIDAIVGATISASSMTRATENVLRAIKLLHNNNLLNP